MMEVVGPIIGEFFFFRRSRKTLRKNEKSQKYNRRGGNKSETSAKTRIRRENPHQPKLKEMLSASLCKNFLSTGRRGFIRVDGH